MEWIRVHNTTWNNLTRKQKHLVNLEILIPVVKFTFQCKHKWNIINTFNTFYQEFSKVTNQLFYKNSIRQRCNQGWGAGKFFCGSGSWLFFKRLQLLIFFPRRLRLQGVKKTRLRLFFFSSGSGSCFKAPKTPGSGSPALPFIRLVVLFL